MKTATLLAGLVVGAVMLVGCQDNTEVDKLRADLTAQQKRFDNASDQWANERDALRSDIEKLKSEIGVLEGGEGEPLSKRVTELESRSPTGEEAEDSELAAEVGELKEKLDQVDQKADDAKRAADEANQRAADVEQRQRDGAAEARPTKDLATALDRLEVSEAEKEQIRQYIIDSKQQILETLEVPDKDGRVYAEELLDIFIKMANGDAKETDAHALYLGLASKDIPGDIQGRTYMQAINDIKARNREDIGRMLSQQDREKLSAAHQDWTDFEVGEGDPWTALYMERLQKYQQEKED